MVDFQIQEHRKSTQSKKIRQLECGFLRQLSA